MFLHSPNRYGSLSGLSVAFEKRWKFPFLTWANKPTWDWCIPNLYLDQPITKSDASHIEAMRQTQLIVLLPTGWDCAAV